MSEIRLLLLATLLAWAPLLWSDQIPIKDFATKLYVMGVPMDEAIQYQASDVPVLLRLLKDPSQVAYHGTILQTLGFIGDPQAVPHIISYIQDGKGEITAEQYRGKSDALLSLGFLINESSNHDALAYLTKSIDHRVWSKRKLLWTTAYFANPIARDMQLSRQAAIGLALSGSQEGHDALRQASEGDGETGSVQPASDNMILMLLEASKTVAGEGLNSYLKHDN